MYHFLAPALMAILVTACQQQTNIQTGLSTLKTSLPSLTRAVQDKAAVEQVSPEAASESKSDEIEWQEVIPEIEPDVMAKSLVTTSAASLTKTPSTTELAPVAMTALDAGEIGEPPAQITTDGPELAASGTLLPQDNNVQISGLIENESASSETKEPVTTLEDAIAKTEVTAVPMVEKSNQDQIVIIEPPKTPDPIHPKTIVGQTIDDLGAHLGLPDFERSDADVKIWQYRLAACITDFFLYLKGDDYIVTGWAWRHPLVGQIMDEGRCQQQIGNLLDAKA